MPAFHWTKHQALNIYTMMIPLC